MRICLLLAVFAIFVIDIWCDDDFVLDAYYWKDYRGKIPYDALPGGTRNGRTTYIGQVLHNTLLIPAEIEPRDRTVNYEWGYTAHQPSNYSKVKIFCTSYPTRFKWIPTGNQRLEKLVADLPDGGYESDTKIYIGRKNFDKDVVVGKVVSAPLQSTGMLQSTLNVVIDNKVTQHGEFNVLAYDPSVDVSEEDKPRAKCSQKKLYIKLFN